MAGAARILIADDEPNLRRVLGAILTREGYDVLLATNGEEAVALFDREPAAIITDLRMPKLDGLGVLRRANAVAPDVPVIIITAHGSIDSAVEAVRAGAFDYIEKPFEQDQIRQVVAKAVRQSEHQRRGPRPMGVAPGTEAVGRFGLVGRSVAMGQLYAAIDKVADTPSTVLLRGESGTGKELVAKALHEQSSRRTAPFIKINCAAIPKTLIESELFGYEKGAFTGAVGSKPGRFELADQGTLFLDEIGEIPIESQVKLLRALQEAEFERVGGIRTIKVDVRLVTATNRDLEKEVRAGNFREDLYYRLNVVPLALPPLRERRNDLPLLVEHILRRFNERLKKQVLGVSPDAMLRLAAYAWPGNIRELENVLERTMLFCESASIGAGDLPPELGGGLGGTAVAPMLPLAATPAATPAERTGPQSLKELVRVETDRVERELIVRALEATRGNVTQAAKQLQISRKSLQLKMKDFGLREKD